MRVSAPGVPLSGEIWVLVDLIARFKEIMGVIHSFYLPNPTPLMLLTNGLGFWQIVEIKVCVCARGRTCMALPEDC